MNALMKKRLLSALIAGSAMLLTGCHSAGTAAVTSAGAKNLDLTGYVLYGDIEASNADTYTPEGKLILGRMTYKSRKVGIPADQKVPTTGSFRSTVSKNLFGAEEQIVEYDFTAGSDAEAKTAMEMLEKQRAEVQAAASDKAAETEN